MRAVLAVLGAALVLAAPERPSARQAPAAQFKSTAVLVSVYATVRDESGRLVPNLTKDDFVVYDNGKAQPLAFFTNDVHPFSVVMMLDRSGSMVEHHQIVRDAGKAFVDQMLPADTARIGSFGDEIRHDPPACTPDPDALTAILDHDLLRAGGSSPVWTAFDRGITAFAERSGRRVLLALTDGFNSPRPGLPITELEDVIRRARYNDVLVYIIGFTATEYGYRPAGRSLGAPGPARPPLLPPGGLPAPQGSSATVTTSRAPYKGLRLLSDDTGGGYYDMDATNDLSATFAEIATELHRQYWMAFTPAKLDGRVHEIEVKVKRRGVEVRARQSYFADPKRQSR